MIKGLSYILTLTLTLSLVGCKTDEEYQVLATKIEALTKEIGQFNAQTIRLKHYVDGERALERQKVDRKIYDDEQNAKVEVALACSALPFSICPKQWVISDFQPLNNAGYWGGQTWRGPLIFFGGTFIKILCWIFLLFAMAQAWRFGNIPKNSEVAKAWEAIAEGKRQLALIKSGMAPERTALETEMVNLRNSISNMTEEHAVYQKKYRHIERALDGLESKHKLLLTENELLEKAIKEKMDLFG